MQTSRSLLSTWRADLPASAAPNTAAGRQVYGRATQAAADLASRNAALADEGGRAIAEVGQFDYEIRYLVKSGQWRWLRGRGRAWPGPDGRCAIVTGGHAWKPMLQRLLPALAWGEKDGTVTNSERRITRVMPVVPPPGEARHDFLVADLGAAELAHDLRHRPARAVDLDREATALGPAGVHALQHAGPVL